VNEIDRCRPKQAGVVASSWKEAGECREHISYQARSVVRSRARVTAAKNFCLEPLGSTMAVCKSHVWSCIFLVEL
jgi:hypothetical protein